MIPCVKKIDNVTYIDMERLWQAVPDVPVTEKLAALLAEAGVSFFDKEKCFVNKPVVAVTGMGGFPVSFDENTSPENIVLNTRSATPAEHLQAMQKTCGLAGLITNLNSGGHTVSSIDKLTTDLGHLSKLRTNIFDFHIFGYPSAIEPNFMRLYKYAGHVGCLTMARTAAQANPPWVVLEPEHLAAAKDLREKINIAPNPFSLKGKALKDYQEGVFGFHPKNAAMILMLNIDLLNLKGTIKEIADEGQEIAWRRIIALVNDQMHILLPAFFQPTASYGYTPPKHWL